MQQPQQHFPTFSVTPHGVMMDGAPLAKSTRRNLPPRTLRKIAGIEEVLTTVKKEECDKPTPRAGEQYPIVTMLRMRAALLSPQPFPPAVAKSLNKADFNPDEPRDDRGRWTDGKTHVEHYEPVAYTTHGRSRNSWMPIWTMRKKEQNN